MENAFEGELVEMRVIVTITLALALLVLQAGCLTLPTDIDQRDRITGRQVFRAVVEATRFEIAPLDGTYLSYSTEELRYCLETAQWIRELPYIPDLRDCDEFAGAVMTHIKLSMPGIPFGLIKYRYVQLEEVIYHMANQFCFFVSFLIRIVPELFDRMSLRVTAGSVAI